MPPSSFVEYEAFVVRIRLQGNRSMQEINAAVAHADALALALGKKLDAAEIGDAFLKGFQGDIMVCVGVRFIKEQRPAEAEFAN